LTQIGHFGDVHSIQYLGTVLKKQNLTQQKQTHEQTRMWGNAQRDAALQNIGGVLCSMPQSLADAHYQWRAVMLPRHESR